jgi:hypothetical protein
VLDIRLKSLSVTEGTQAVRKDAKFVKFSLDGKVCGVLVVVTDLGLNLET